MTELKHSVLVVDDSLPELQLTVGFLKQHYQVSATTSGERALEMIAANKPNIVLLDVSMPEMDGYEVCRKIRAHDQHLKVIFVSANDTTTEILKGYSSGGNDYVVKPFTPDILLHKIELAVRVDSEIEQMSHQAKDLAMEAMTSFGELGSVLTFLRSSFRVSSIDGLAALIISFMDSHELTMCLQLRTQTSTKNFTNQGEISPLEEELLLRISRMPGRFAENAQRMFINYDHASILIKNMPADDEFKMGRLRDNLAIMLEGADEKLAMLSFEEGIDSALSVAQATHQSIEAENAAIVAKNLEELQGAFLSLGLSLEQEQKLLSIVNKSQAEFTQNVEKTRVVEEQISNIQMLVQAKLAENKSTGQAAGSFDFL